MIASGSILICLLGAAVCAVTGTLSKQGRSVVATAVVAIAAVAVAYILTSETLLQRAARDHGGMKGLLMRPTSDGGESTPWARDVERVAFIQPALVAAPVIVGISIIASSSLRRRQSKGLIQVWGSAFTSLLAMLAFAVARNISTWDIFI